MSEHLQPCPFCAGRPFWQSEHDADGFGLFWSIRCRECGNGTQQHYVSHGNDCPQFREEVRASWNRRPVRKHADKCGIYNFAGNGDCTCGADAAYAAALSLAGQQGQKT